MDRIRSWSQRVHYSEGLLYLVELLHQPGEVGEQRVLLAEEVKLIVTLHRRQETKHTHTHTHTGSKTDSEGTVVWRVANVSTL